VRIAGLLALLALASPAAAEGLVGRALCDVLWADLTGRAAAFAAVTGTVAGFEGGACVVEDVRLDLPGEYVPDWEAARLRLSGAALGWLVGEAATPDRLEIGIEGLHLAIQTGMPQMDYLYAAQTRAQTIRAQLALVWDKQDRTLTVERLDVDFPGDNRVQLTAHLDGVDLSSVGAMQMSATGFALREADLTVRTHGLFEGYLLMTLGPSLLPDAGDMEAAMAELKAEAVALVRELPVGTVPVASQDALAVLIAELPNPAGTLTVAVRAADGFGPTRFLGYAATGVPDSMDEAAPLLDGVTVDIGWTHEDTR
jgi:hypothetical protein